jgi:glycosyltransferase involved in cell wall biosynthesis
MSAEVRISVVIPCRNAEAWIAETIASVLVQAGASFEVIVVDDGSTDRSADIARSAGSGVRVIAQPGSGVSAARNLGTRESRGEFIQYLDADDLLEPGTFAERLTAITQDEADVALTSWVRWEQQPHGDFVSGVTTRRRLGARPDVELLTDAWWPPGAVLYRRTIVDRIGSWRVDLPIIQDARFLLDAALCGARFVHVDAVGLRYRIHGSDSLSRRDPRAFVEDCFRSAAQLHDRWGKDGGMDDARARALVRVYGYVARSIFPLDRSRFEDVLDRIHSIDARYRPEQPKSLRALSGVIGYRSAEHVALWWRHLKGVTWGGQDARQPTRGAAGPS